jgi:hypothetical protein
VLASIVCRERREGRILNSVCEISKKRVRGSKIHLNLGVRFTKMFDDIIELDDLVSDLSCD